MLFEGKFVKVDLVDGHYEVVRRPEAVGIMALSPLGILLVRQYRPAVGKWLWEIPAGLVEPGESVFTTAARELREETGYKALPENFEYLGYFHPTVGYADEVLHLVKVWVELGSRQDLSLDPGEHIEDVRWFSIEEFRRAAKMLNFTDSKTLVVAMLLY